MVHLSRGATLQGGKYVIERVLGQGSFGIAYLATAAYSMESELGPITVETKVAIKEFFMRELNTRGHDGCRVEGVSGDVCSNYRGQFRREAKNLAKLSHPNIVKVLEVFDENNTTYYAMEYINGTNLDDYICDRGLITEEDTLPILREIGSALDYMHSRKMLHLDLKPRNIMRRNDGHIYLIDFGLSKQFTKDGEPESSTTIGCGTRGYAPLEQVNYRPRRGYFPATLDVYALGATFFKMLTGKLPPDASSVLNNGFPIEELKAKRISRKTIDALQHAMRPYYHNRTQSVKSFIATLPYKTPTPPRQRKWDWLITALMVIGLPILVAFVMNRCDPLHSHPESASSIENADAIEQPQSYPVSSPENTSSSSPDEEQTKSVFRHY